MVFFPLLFWLFSQPVDKELRYEDFIYEDQIKTVRLFPASDSREIKMLPAVASLGGVPMLLEFDDLQPDRGNYYAKILSCNHDWTPSRLHDLDFLSEYNEFNILDYAYSNNTIIPYVHYRFQLPEVKLPGNYLVIIYRDGEKSDLMLSKRFMISSDVVTLKHDSNVGMNTLKATNQSINFTIDYNRADIPNPLETVNVVIRQNQRWDNAQKDIKPSFIREGNKTLEYRFFNTDHAFQAGNEFRFVDFGSLNYPGQNTGRLERDRSSIRLYVAIDAPRADQRYAQYRDLDGGFIVINTDASQSGETFSQYLNVVFTLQSPKAYSSKIYVAGAFNNWMKDPAYEMKFNDGQYSGEVLLKQGFYNYAYITSDPSESIEGNYFETENFYEILVYNRSYYPDADLLIGYYSFKVNPR